MTLTTHAIVGAAAAQFFPQSPIVAFFAGFVSHFIIDTFPHQDYDHYLSSLRNNTGNGVDTEIEMWSTDFIKDCFIVGFDILLGVLLSIFIFTGLGGVSTKIIFIGVIAGISPDFLHFAYWKIRKEPFTSIEHFHNSIQGDKIFKMSFWKSAALQIIFLVLIVFITIYLKKL